MRIINKSNKQETFYKGEELELKILCNLHVSISSIMIDTLIQNDSKKDCNILE